MRSTPFTQMHQILSMRFVLFLATLIYPLSLKAEISTANISGSLPEYSRLLVVIKADDLTDEKGTVNPSWKRFADFSIEHQLKVGIGIITRSLEGEKPAYFDWIQSLQATGLFEFWNHGYDHKRWTDEEGVQKWEFSGSGEEHQKLHLEKGNALAQEKLGFTFHSFGAPYNATDEVTARILSADPNYKVWLYGKLGNVSSRIFVAQKPAGISLEPSALKPDFAAFMEAFEKQTEAPVAYFVLQGHPPFWSEADFAEFVRIIDFLKSRGAVFLTPLELAERMNSES